MGGTHHPTLTGTHHPAIGGTHGAAIDTPGNRLEKLAGNRAGEYSLRINDPWRICFRWRVGYAYDVEITDYHWE